MISSRSMMLVARMYYLDGLDQQEIADIVGTSRSRISRMLTAARERGIVRISVDEYEPRERELETALVERFGLHRAVVVRAFSDGPSMSAGPSVISALPHSGISCIPAPVSASPVGERCAS